MRTIIKGTEPASLTQHRRSPHATYDNYQEKDALRESLVQEQRGLCCYCMNRIRPDGGKIKIEHWHPQSQFSDEQLNYGNLLAACSGNTNGIKHCDTSKADLLLSKNPANPDHRVEERIHYRLDGMIVSDDAAFNAQLNEVLNLNTALLKNNRKAALDGLIGSLPKIGPISAGQFNRLLQEWNGESDSGELKPFCQVIVYWLRKKLDRV